MSLRRYSWTPLKKKVTKILMEAHISIYFYVHGKDVAMKFVENIIIWDVLDMPVN